MKFTVSGKNIDVTDAMKNYTVKKLGKLNKFFQKETEAHITFSTERNRQIVEGTFYLQGVILRAEESGDDLYVAIDKVADVIERQIRRNKTRLEKRFHGSQPMPEYFMSPRREKDEELEFKIVKSKKFSIKPMTIDEAILQMNLIGHEFFVFSNGDMGTVNVVYKRKDGNYGLIEPET